MSLHSKLRKVIIEIIRESHISQCEIDSCVKKNANVISACINDYIDDFGENETQVIDNTWLEDYLFEYLQ
jgi:hypothetical protein